MFLPRATYRVQLHKEFNFQHLKAIIPYLDRLGISTIYASPFFKATAGSMHGYDVLDPLQINPEIGTFDELRAIREELKARNMAWIQDIVPNHMAFSFHNSWMFDVMEKGIHSQYYRFFDIDWLHPDEALFGKLMVPTLGAPLEDILKAKEINLRFGEQGFYFSYYDHVFPVCMRSYEMLTTIASEKLSKLAPQNETIKKYFSLAKRLHDFVSKLPKEAEAVDGWESLRNELLALTEEYPKVKAALFDVAQDIENDPSRLNHLLDEQYFRLSYWKNTEKKINYRRFFTVNDLICLNMQDKKVFDTYHIFIDFLLREDLIQGLRVDHIDGLLDPTTYLQRLRNLVGEETFITVEKILEGDEIMPAYWPIAGSSGYDYLALSNQLFTHAEEARRLLQYYQSNIEPSAYKSLVFQNKAFILKNRMAGELDNLIRLLQTLDIIPYQDTNHNEEKLKAALGRFLIAFPIYRIYSNTLPFSEQDMKIIKDTFESAEKDTKELETYFQQLREIFNGVDDKDEAGNQNKLYFSMRSQQFTGPLAAKGVEDTTFYQYFPLISHNEVGDAPEQLGMTATAFHQHMQSRENTTMNTTSTHDTKRGEDARMRINVLSEIPDLWIEKVNTWHSLNASYVKKTDGYTFPDLNDEYFLYQTLIGTFPFHITADEDNYEQRLHEYLVKAVREAKRHSNWAKPNEAYEKAFTSFAQQLLSDQKFMQDFKPFAEKIALSGVVYSIAQILLKLCVPGVPDVYQGTEFWDLSMVDPDNRRPVDYPARENALNQMEAIWQDQPLALLEELKKNLLNPNIKLFTMYQTLNARQQYRPIFEEGEYLPIQVSEDFDVHLLAFRRVHRESEALIVIPRNIHQMELNGNLPLGQNCWKNAQLLSDDTSGKWHNVFTNQSLQLEKQAAVAAILHHFPIALLIKEN